MELINKLRKSRKGFTLVEIIVVLVILAILAAFTIPAMLGFVNDAKKKAYIAEARECYVAAQAISTEMMATGSTSNQAHDEIVSTSATGKMKKYLNSDITGTITAATVDSNGKVSSITYTTGGSDSFTITIAGGKATIS